MSITDCQRLQLKTMPSSHNVQATRRCFVPGTMPCGCIGARIGGYSRDHAPVSPALLKEVATLITNIGSTHAFEISCLYSSNFW